MTESMTGAELAATRHLIGLSQAELADLLGVGRDAVKDWEHGRFSPRAGVVDEVLALRHEHDIDAERLARAAGDAFTIVLQPGPRPPGWYIGLAARVLAVDPLARIEWYDQSHGRRSATRVTRVLRIASKVELERASTEDLLLWDRHLGEGLREGDATGDWTVTEAEEQLARIGAELSRRD